MVLIDEIFDSDDVLARFKASPARTEDENQELLKAVALKYAHDGDKWARMTDAFNERAVEKKSKQWIKRVGAKLCEDAPIEVVPATQESSRRQQKKSERAERLNEAAARAVAEDMPKDAEAKAAFISKKLVEHFWECIEAGDYPEENSEAVFGIKMGDSIGELVYGSWRALQLKGLITKEDLTQNLIDGTLPLRFRRLLEDLKPNQHTPQTLGLLHPPDVISKMPWDETKLQRCASSSAQATVSISLREALLPVKSKVENTPEAKKEASAQKFETLKAAEALGLNLSPELTMRLSGAEGPEGAKEDGYSWTQTADEVEVVIPLASGVSKNDVKIEIKQRELVLKAPHSLHLQLHGAVLVEGSGWTLGKGQAVVTLEKKETGKKWPALTLAAKK